MLRSTTAQEALIAELLGDMTRLIQRAESFATTMDKAQEKMTDAAWLLNSAVEPFRHALAAEIEQVKGIAVKTFIHQTNEVAALGQRSQNQAMADAAQHVVEREMVQPLRQFAGFLQRLIDRANQPWKVWLSHTATAVTSAVASAWLIVHFFGR